MFMDHSNRLGLGLWWGSTEKGSVARRKGWGEGSSVGRRERVRGREKMRGERGM